MCAALYAIGAYMSAYIPSPWGFGQFRPAVIIPAFFATIFGPMPAAVGAAIGTLIADSTKHGYLYPGSYLAAVWGNFVGFYVFGYIVRKKFTWGRFVLASNVALLIGNIIIAFLYVFIFKFLYLNNPEFVGLTSDTLVFLSIGLVIWFFITELPFLLLVTPVLIRAAVAVSSSIVPENMRTYSLREELPKTTFSLAMLIPGIIMIFMGIATTYTEMGNLMSLKGTTLVAVQVLFYGSGIILSALGVLIYTGQRFLWQTLPIEKTKNKNKK
jgi:hypothetical protein